MAELTPYSIRAPNILGDWNLLRTLGLDNLHYPSPYLPIDKSPTHFKEIPTIYRSAKGDNEALSQALEILRTNSPFPAPLRIPHEGAEQRQAAVRELVDNPDLAARLERLLRGQQIFSRDTNDHRLSYQLSVEYVREYLDGIVAMSTAQPQAVMLNRAITWAEETRESTLVRELYTKHRKISDARLFSVYSERYNGVRIGILRPGINPADVFDFLDEELTEYEGKPKKRGGILQPDVKRIINFPKQLDEEEIHAIVGRARQRFDILNNITANTLLYPLLMMHAQLHDLYGAYALTKRFSAVSEIAYPTWGETLNLEQIMPIRIVLQNFIKRNDRAIPTTISIDRLANIEGPNSTGKTETLRTLFLSTILAEMGAGLPAASATLPVFSDVNFMHGNQAPNHRGSEYGAATQLMLWTLNYVQPSSLILLDEFGDSTNAPTACETARRLIPPLLDIGCTVVSTTQHGAISDVVTGLGGRNFTVENYQLAPSEAPLDYQAAQTLDHMGFTTEAITKALAARMPPPRNSAGEDDDFEEVDLPF